MTEAVTHYTTDNIKNQLEEFEGQVLQDLKSKVVLIQPNPQNVKLFL